APTTGYATFVALAPREHPTTQSALVARQRVWLASGDPAAGRYIPFEFPTAIGAALPAGGCTSPAYEGGRIAAARIEVTVSCPEAAALALKVTFHPDWRVTADGGGRPTFMVAPACP